MPPRSKCRWPALRLDGPPCFDGCTLADKPSLPVWQPLTFSGVASFSHAPANRLLVVQSAVAVWVAACLVFGLSRTWFPVVTKAVAELQDFGTVRGGQLAWPVKEAVLLGENRFLGLVVDLEESGETGQTSDLQFEFGRQRVKVVSLLGYTSFPYEPHWNIELNRQVLDPWWGAWRPVIAFAVGLATAGVLLVGWFLLGTLGCVPLRLLAWLAGRDTTLRGCWRIAAAAWLPGSLWMGGAMLLYMVEQLSLVGLALAVGFQLLLGLTYSLVAPFRLPAKVKATESLTGNPFVPPPAAESAQPSQSAERPATTNPFQPPDGSQSGR